MSDLREAAEMALEALQKIYIAPEHEEYIRVWWPKCEEAQEALRQALSQPPCQTGSQCIGGKCPQCVPTYEFECPRCGHCCQQKEWVGLTEDEKQFFKAMGFSGIDIVEAKLKEKNT